MLMYVFWFSVYAYCGLSDEIKQPIYSVFSKALLDTGISWFITLFGVRYFKIWEKASDAKITNGSIGFFWVPCSAVIVVLADHWLSNVFSLILVIIASHVLWPISSKYWIDLEKKMVPSKSEYQMFHDVKTSSDMLSLSLIYWGLVVLSFIY